jgi:hypothetical protein
MQRSVKERTEWRVIWTNPFVRDPLPPATGETREEALRKSRLLPGDTIVGYQKRTVYETPWEDAE